MYVRELLMKEASEVQNDVIFFKILIVMLVLLNCTTLLSIAVK